MARRKRNPKERLLLTRCVDCDKEMLIYVTLEEAREKQFRCVVCMDKFLVKRYGEARRNPKSDWRDFIPLIVIGGGMAYIIWWGYFRRVEQQGG